MKASLQLKMGQQLTMTPQLQQAIRLLQLSTLDLQQEIQTALDSNPLLDVDEEFEGDTPNDQSTQSESKEPESPANDEPTAAQEAASENATDSEWNETIPDDLPTDSDWDDTWQASAATSSTTEGHSSSGGGEDFDFDSRNGTTDDLQDHLLWQLNLTTMTDNDRLIAINIIEGVDDDGYLKVSIEDILTSLDPKLEIELDEVQAVLNLLQQFEPSGVCTRDLQECLSLQLRQLPEDTPCLSS